MWGSPKNFEAIGLGVLFILKLKELVKDLHKRVRSLKMIAVGRLLH